MAGIVSTSSAQADQFEKLARDCDKASEGLARAIKSLDRGTEPSGKWTGPSATSFRQVVGEQLRAAVAAHGALRAAAAAFRQDAASIRAYLAQVAEQARQDAVAKAAKAFNKLK